MKKLCIFTLYPERGASSKYRIFLYKEGLESKFNVKWFSFWNDAYVKEYMYCKKKYALRIFFLYLFFSFKRLFQLFFIAPKADVCFFQKTCIPKFRYNHISSLKKKGIRVVFDVDDAVYTAKRDFSNEIAKLSDAVICGNETLRKHYEAFNNNVFVLPTVENTNLFRPYWKDSFNTKTIGWIGSLSTIDNLDLVVDSVNRLVEKHPEVNLLVISNSVLDYDKKVKNCHFVKWAKDSYISELSNITIGIMPLKDNEVNQGKCGFKLVQYLNMNKPVIGSKIGVNEDIIGNCGFSVKTESEWDRCLELLLYDKNKYQECLNNIQNEFLPKYSYDSVLKKLIGILIHN